MTPTRLREGRLYKAANGSRYQRRRSHHGYSRAHPEAIVLMNPGRKQRCGYYPPIDEAGWIAALMVYPLIGKGRYVKQ
jgi:hypothetical protein